jgi:hypothetical protein
VLQPFGCLPLSSISISSKAAVWNLSVDFYICCCRLRLARAAAPSPVLRRHCQGDCQVYCGQRPRHWQWEAIMARCDTPTDSWRAQDSCGSCQSEQGCHRIGRCCCGCSGQRQATAGEATTALPVQLSSAVDENSYICLSLPRC